jgi:polysaccharide transporter, PST family
MGLRNNITFLVLDKIYVFIISFILSILTYRYLGASNIGILSSARNFWMLFGFLLSMGLDTIIIKIMNKSSDKLQLVSAAISLKFFGGIIAIILCFLLGVLYSDDNNFIAVLLVLSINGLFTCFGAYDLYFQSIKRSDIGAKNRIIAKTISSIFHMALFLFTQELIYFALVSLTYNVSLSVLHINSMMHQNLKPHRLFVLPETKIFVFLMKSAWPLILASMSIPLFLQSDVLMVNYILGNTQAGIYSAAVKLVLPINLFPTVIMIAYFPMLLDMIGDEFNIAVTRLSSMLTILSFGIAIIVSSFAEEITVLLYGPEYYESAKILRVQVWTLIIAFSGPLGSRWLIAKDKTIHELLKTLIAAGINLIVNYYAIHKYGPVGASYASLIAYTSANIIYFAIIPSTRDFTIIQINSLRLRNIMKTHLIFKSQD